VKGSFCGIRSLNDWRVQLFGSDGVSTFGQ
jgi:hypothetical protein